MSKHPEEGLGKHRFEALSDGIFAIAMTLLILDLKFLKIPDAQMTGGVLWQTLVDLWPKFAICFTSFMQLGVYWIAHTGYSHFLKRTDRPFLWLNLFYLMTIVFVPFSTAVLGDYPTHRVAVILYAVNMNAIGIMLYATWHYATDRHRLVGPELEREVIVVGKRRMLRGIVLYSIAMLLALVAPQISVIIYVLVVISFMNTSRLDKHWTHSHG